MKFFMFFMFFMFFVLVRFFGGTFFGFFVEFFAFVFFLEDGAASQSIGRGMRLSLLVLGFDQAGRNNGDIIVGQRSILASGAFPLSLTLRDRGVRVTVGWGKFFRASRGGLPFVARLSEKPTGQSPRVPTWPARANRTRALGPRSRWQSLRNVRLRLIVHVRLKSGRRSGRSWPIAIFCEGLTGQKDRLFRTGTRRSGRSAVTGTFLAATVAVAWFKIAVRAARFVAAARLVRALVTLRRSVLGRRQIAAAALGTPSSASAPAASAPTAPAPTVTAAAEVLTTAITAAIATAEILPAALRTAIGARILLRGIVLTPEILRRGSVGFGLTFIQLVGGSTVSERIFVRTFRDGRSLVLVGESGI